MIYIINDYDKFKVLKNTFIFWWWFADAFMIYSYLKRLLQAFKNFEREGIIPEADFNKIPHAYCEKWHAEYIDQLIKQMIGK